MSDTSSPGPTTTVHDWDTYWHGSSDGVAYGCEGVGHPLVRQFWQDFFSSARESRPGASFIDFASGNGAVIDSASQNYGNQIPSFTCLDTSEWAIKTLTQRFPGVQGLVADALAVPLPSASFDIATSQFGVEYAGIEAVDEMARLISPGGQIAMLMHMQGGVIFEECAASLGAIHRMQEIEFIPKALHMYQEGHICLRGEAENNSRANYDTAVREMLPVYKSMEDIMHQYGEHVAGDTVLKLYQDVDRINQRLAHHDPDEVVDWLKKMQDELIAYCGRMQSMCDSALDKNAFDGIVNGLQQRGFELDLAEPLTSSDAPSALAWSIIATKSP